jgi:hypothetical protein
MEPKLQDDFTLQCGLISPHLSTAHVYLSLKGHKGSLKATCFSASPPPVWCLEPKLLLNKGKCEERLYIQPSCNPKFKAIETFLTCKNSEKMVFMKNTKEYQRIY